MDKNIVENISFEKGFVIIKLVGKLSILESQAIEVVLEKYIQQNKKNIILDLEKVSYISSSFIGLLANYKRLLQSQKGHFEICAPNSFVLKILTVTNLIKLFTPYQNVENALEELTPEVSSAENK